MDALSISIRDKFLHEISYKLLVFKSSGKSKIKIVMKKIIQCLWGLYGINGLSIAPASGSATNNVSKL